MPPCAPTPAPGRRRYAMWPAVCTHARRRLVRLVLGHTPYVLVETRPNPAGRMAMRIRSGGGVTTPGQIAAVLRTAVDVIEAAGTDPADEGKEPDRA